MTGDDLGGSDVNAAKVNYLREHILRAMRGDAMPAWRSPEFALILGLLRELSTPAAAAQGDLVLRQVGITALEGLLYRLTSSMLAEAECVAAIAAARAPC